MKTDRVYTGLDTKENVILVYKKDENKYIDLLEKDNQVFPLENINLSSLKKLNNIIDLVKYSSPTNIKRKFEKNKDKINKLK